tara:strand:+ start:128 stop:754 length:627 start_codon:yes stop_codon:yes gene_type:complete
MAVVYRVFLEKLGGTVSSEFIGNVGDLFYDPSVRSLKISDGSTAGGLSITAAGGGLAALLEDTSPQLGGTLDANSNTIDMGTNNITDTKVGEWDTVYGWGNHASAGYLTSASDFAWSEVTANQAVVAGNAYIVDTSSAITLTFPASGTLGELIKVIDGTGNANSNNISLDPNGGKIQGVATNFLMDYNEAGMTFVYYNTTRGWIVEEN